MKLICLIIFQTILANTDQRLKLILQPFGELRCIVVWKLGGSSFLSRRGTGGFSIARNQTVYSHYNCR